MRLKEKAEAATGRKVSLSLSLSLSSHTHSLSLSLSVCLCLSLSLSLSRTHTLTLSAQEFAKAVEYLDAALILWPDHPVDGDPELKKARAFAQQRIDAEQLFEQVSHWF